MSGDDEHDAWVEIAVNDAVDWVEHPERYKDLARRLLGRLEEEHGWMVYHCPSNNVVGWHETREQADESLRRRAGLNPETPDEFEVIEWPITTTGDSGAAQGGIS